MPFAKFNYELDYNHLNLRTNPALYKTGKGEQGVLLVQPYKNEILPYWKFKTPLLAAQSSKKIYSLFLQYKKQQDFVGMDIARKFLQMGYTRSRRYANHKSGRKYKGPVPAGKKGISGSHGRNVLQNKPDALKAQSAAIFMKVLLKVKKDKLYNTFLLQHKETYKT